MQGASDLAIPAGWKLVPEEPTDAMWEAHWRALRLSPKERAAWFAVPSLRGPGPHESGCVTAWRAMLAAAPPAPSLEAA